MSAEFERKELTTPRGEINPPFSNCPDGFTVTRYDSEGGYTAERETKAASEIITGYCGLAGKP
jgi:hypothetical protein